MIQNCSFFFLWVFLKVSTGKKLHKGKIRRMICDHVYKLGKALENLPTNGWTTDPSKWKHGEGISASSEARLIYVDKCVKCGKSIPLLVSTVLHLHYEENR